MSSLLILFFHHSEKHSDMEDKIILVQAQKETAFIKEMIDQDLNRIPKSERRPAVAVRNSKEDPKIQRNEPCPCGSSKKYKHCCINVQV